MFDRSMERARSGANQAAEARSTVKSGPSSSSSSSNRNQCTPSRMSSFAGSATGLDRTLSGTPPVAESTHIGSTSFSSAWNGTSFGGQSKRRPTSPLLNNRTLFKSSGNLTGIGRANSRVLTDAQSPGLVNRLVRYYDRSQSQTMNRSQSLSSVYNKPGQFPLVQLRKQELRYANSGASRRNGNFSFVRIAPPERSLFQTTKRSNIFRSGSLLLPTTNESSGETSLFGGLGSARNGPSSSGGGGGGGGAGNEADVENRVITPCAELEATPTRSVLDALKEISRKRINSEELDADRIKKQCQELSELDAAGSGPPTSTAAVAIGTHGMATKRSREQASECSPSSPTELGPGLGGVGRVLSSGGEQQSQKKRLCIKNNDILSSLSSSLVTMNTPKRTMGPRAERRFNAHQAASMSMSTPAIGTMPTSSSTMLGLATPEKFSNMALNTPESLRRSESPRASNGHTSRASSNLDHWKQPMYGASKEPMELAPPQPHRAPPKITLFNRPYETTITSSLADKSGSPSARGTSRIIASDGEEDEHGEGSGKVQFVRPKEKSPNDVTLAGSSTSGFSCSRDPLKKPAPSKLTVMLKCLSGDLDDYEEEVEQQQQPPRLSQALTQSRTGFSLGRSNSAGDTVDAVSKELPTSVASKPVTVTVADKVVTSVNTLSSPTSSTVTNGLSALINNPIKDTGLGKIVSPVSKEHSTEKTTTKPNEEPKPPKVTDAPADTAKSLTFTFGSGSATATVPSTPPSTTASSSGITMPVKPATATTCAGQSGTVSTATTFTFGTPAQKSTVASSTSPLAALSNSNLMSFSPAVSGKLPTPVLQFGSSPSVTLSTVTTTTTATPASMPTFSFTGGASTTTVSATATTTSPLMASGASLPTFGIGSTFGGFKLPVPSGQPQTNINSTTIATVPTMTTSASTAAAPPTFSFGFSSAASNKPATTPATIPTFGAAASLSPSTVVSTVGSATTTSTPVAAAIGSGTFTFGSVTTTPNAVSAAPVSAFTFGAVAAAAAKASPTATGTNSAVSSSVAPATTFPTFGSLAGSAGPAAATTTSNTGGTVANATATPAQPFMFGGVKPAPTTTGNIFGAATTATSNAPSDGSGSKRNLFASPTTQPQPNAASSIFGAVAGAGQAPTAGNTGNTTAGSSIFGGATGGTATAATSPFTFGATKAVAASPASTNGAPSNVLGSNTGTSIFGNAAPINSPAAAPAPTGGLFTFGSTKPTAPSAAGGTQQNTATPSQQQQQQSGIPTLSNSQIVPTFGAAGTGASTNAAPFTFGAVANKSATGTTPGAGIFGNMSATNNTGGTVGGNSSATAVPTFGASAVMNGGTSAVPTFGGGSIFGNVTRPGTATANAPNSTPGSMFGAPAQNGPQNASNNAGQATAPQTASSGGLFTFGATNANSAVANNNNNNNASSGTFGAANVGVSNTFGGFNVAGGGLANGIGSSQTTVPNKPFTFGATNNSNAGAGTMPQNNMTAQQATPGGAPSGFNFNLGSNAAKPFNFTGGIGSVNTNGNVASPPMFGSPVQPANTNPTGNASPFTFGAMVNGGPTGGNNATATPGPFTFGASAAQQQGPGVGGAGITSPFNFSAGNVAAVAPQPQQQPGAAFSFGGNTGGQQQHQQPQPFGMVGGVQPTFGAPPAFGAPGVGGVVPGGGVMPTFSIGTNSTPNGPTAGQQRRIKVATRRVK